MTLALLFVLGGVIKPGSRNYRRELEATDANLYTVYLINNGWHQELALPRCECADAARLESAAGLAGGNNGYLILGWGDREFFTSTPTLELMTFRKTVNALLWPSESVLKVRFTTRSPSGWNKVTAVSVTGDMLERLYDFAWEEIDPTEGSPVPLPREEIHPAYGASLFFPGQSRYTAVYNCNNWTGRALRKSNIPSGLWTPWTWGVGE